jgi:hypothetical protein
MPKKATAKKKTTAVKKKPATAQKKTAVAKKRTPAAPKKSPARKKKTAAVKTTPMAKKPAVEKKTSKAAGAVIPPNPYGVLKSSKPTIKEALRQNKARDARLSIQNNPDGLPWINNKVIKENLVGKRKTG